MLVQREPVFYGRPNRLAHWRFVEDEDGSINVSYQEPVSPPADAYRVEYRYKSESIRKFFEPAHWIDRQLRPSYWPAPDPREIIGC